MPTESTGHKRVLSKIPKQRPKISYPEIKKGRYNQNPNQRKIKGGQTARKVHQIPPNTLLTPIILGCIVTHCQALQILPDLKHAILTCWG
jgi:hypothetical protein